jgi:hypothetical protein
MARTALVLGFLVLHSWPQYSLLTSRYVESTWQAAMAKVQDPLLDMASVHPDGSHESKLTFRMTVPVAGKLLRLDADGIRIWSGMMAAGMLAVVLASARNWGWPGSVGVGLAVAGSWAGACGVIELRGGFYDAIAIGFAMLAWAAPSGGLAFAAATLGLWADERALLSLALVLIASAHRGWIGWAMVAYGALGLALTLTLGWQTPGSNIGLAVLWEQAGLLPAGAWMGLNAAWLLPAGALVTAARRRDWRFCALFGGALAAVVAGSGLVYDITRTAAYALPAVVVAVQYLGDEGRRWGWGAGILALVLPLYYAQGPAALMPVASWCGVPQ